jgi:hypothetical protein
MPLPDSGPEDEGMARPPRFIAENRPRVRRPGPTVHLRPSSGPTATGRKGHKLRRLGPEVEFRTGPIAGCTRDKCYHRMHHEGGIR